MNKQQTIDELEKLGLREDDDFYVEDIFRVETYLMARAVNIVSESSYEADNYDAWGCAELEEEMHTEKTVMGFQLLDKDLEKITFDELTKDINPLIPNGVNNCGICAKPLVRKRGMMKDQREIEGQLRCFDHIGQPVVDAPAFGSSDSEGDVSAGDSQ